ncbi:cytochrome c oxidase subunit II [Fodinicurvata halophila]|uniref:Cytochrome c oxidase subunit 2 n=1 Tax=Fodinicurvata halophila TaxID=1419723 RepID=A0ABV8UI27_9PROT
MALVSRWATTVVAAFYALMALAVPANAQGQGEPVPWGLGLQEAASVIKTQMQDFHNMLLVIITAITLFVLALLIYVMVRFRASKNPTPSKTTHNTLIEIVWTVVPVLILVIIAVPSFKLLYAEDQIPDSEMTIKATGKQWFWTYEYEHPEEGLFQFDSFMLTDEEAAEEGLPRLLATDTAVVLPVDTNIRILVTAGDVLHSFAMPAFGIKTDAVPGRINETWVNIKEEGTYYGQCSEICGQGHAYMPIMIKAVSQEEYEDWLDQAAEEYAAAPGQNRPIQLADAARAE